jgi:hypothetical protein
MKRNPSSITAAHRAGETPSHGEWEVPLAWNELSRRAPIQVRIRQAPLLLFATDRCPQQLRRLSLSLRLMNLLWEKSSAWKVRDGFTFD